MHEAIRCPNPMERPDNDTYFMRMAELVATRSTCLRRKVGAVVVKEKRVLTTGYNGAPTGLPHCDEVGCRREQLGVPSGERYELCRALHAEQNVLIQAVIHGVNLKDSVIYVTNQPCVTCSKMLIGVGVKEIVICEGYPDELAVQMLEEAKIKVRRAPAPGRPKKP